MINTKYRFRYDDSKTNIDMDILPIMSSLKALIFQAFSNLLPHRNRAKSDEQSWYPVLNSYRWVHFIKHPLINDYKGYFPSVSL